MKNPDHQNIHSLFYVLCFMALSRPFLLPLFFPFLLYKVWQWNFLNKHCSEPFMELFLHIPLFARSIIKSAYLVLHFSFLGKLKVISVKSGEQIGWSNFEICLFATKDRAVRSSCCGYEEGTKTRQAFSQQHYVTLLERFSV